MKFLAILAFVIISLTSTESSLIANQECSQGITFWCQHIMNAKKCNAVDFCIQTVWTKHNVQYDSNPLCDDCKEWVQQARDFLSQKKLFDEIIKTLEWSCELCPDKDGCKKIIEDNVHELQKLIVSKMSPDAVCSAAHFCNNQHFTELFKIQKNKPKRNDNLLPFTCGQCNIIGDLIEKKLETADNDDMLEGFLKICGEMSSFTDSCSSLVLKNFNEIRSNLPKVLNKEKMCHATCVQHHKYNEGIVDIQPSIEDPDVPCELCQQLMLHLRELLIANTTEIEFKNMMEGFCEQMSSIKDECDNIVEQYYDTIYKSLVNGLDADKTCVMIKICKPKQAAESYLKAPKMPLVASDLFPKPNIDESAVEVHTITQDSSIRLYQNGALCTACEYTMQLVHLEISKNTVHDEILKRVKDECNKLPQYKRECADLIEMFGDQILEAVDIGTNPRLVCPLLKMCPPSFDFHYLQQSAVSEKPTCPFCLFAMQEIKEVVSSNSTKESITNVLNGLCTHLSMNLQSQCIEFVKAYSTQVVDMIIADFTPQEACIFIKLCSNSEPKINRYKMPKSLDSVGGDSEEFTDFDDSTEAETKKLVDNPQCNLCKSLIELLEQRVIDIKSKDEIRRELENSCARLRKFSKECKAFVDKYSDRIVDLVSKELEPEKVCQELLFCVTENERDMQDYDFGLDIMARSYNIEVSEENVESTACVLCEFVMTKLENELNDKNTDEEIKQTVKNICTKMPQTISRQCGQFIDYYFDMIIALIETTKPSEICATLKVCPAKDEALLESRLTEIKNDIYTCAVCKGAVESLDTIIEDPQVDTNLENLEEKICVKFAGKFKDKCHNLASTYGLAMINVLKSVAESDSVCYQLKLCSYDKEEPTGMVKIF